MSVSPNNQLTKGGSIKNAILKPLDKKVIQPYGIESPDHGLKWVADSKIFFGHNPIGSNLSTKELAEQAEELLPDWFQNKDGEPITLTSSEIRERLCLGGGNKQFGEPRLQLFYHARSRSFIVIDAMELIDQINVAEVMAKTGQRAQERLEYALQIATNQMKLELSEEQQQQVLEGYSSEVQGVELATAFADKRNKTLQQAVSAVLDTGEGEEQAKLVHRTKKD